MWNRSAANKITGLMTVVCTDWNGNEFFRGEFADVIEANRAGENAERRMTQATQAGQSDDELLAEFAALSDDDLLNELLG